MIHFLVSSSWGVRHIDHRISTAVIFFAILMLWAKGEQRPHIGLRRALSAGLLCVTNWCIRWMIDNVLHGTLLDALGYSALIAAMCVAFFVSYWLCYKNYRGEYLYVTLIAVTVYRLAWNVFKALTALLGILRINLPWSGYSPANSIYSYCIYFAVILICYGMYRMVNRDDVQVQMHGLSGMAIFLVVCQMLLEFMYRLYVDTVSSAFMFYFTALLYCVINYVLLMVRLYNVKLEQDNANMQAFIRNKQQYYQMSREGIISLQTKCHDLKHQIARIRSAEGQRQLETYMNRLEDSIDEYNTVIETGNEHIDVVLTEKNIICSTCGIRFTYMIDGTLFDFMSEMDIFSLFGNVMDNAIESMHSVAQTEKRFITLKAARRSGITILYVENYFANPLKYQDGIPVTSKTDKHHHGFGLRSIMSIAEKYGGAASIDAKDNLFRLTVTMRDAGKADN